MKKVILLFLLFINFLFSQDFISSEKLVFGTDETNDTLKKDLRVPVSKSLYLSYLDYPKHLYKNQRFEVVIKALIIRKDFDSIGTEFINGFNMIPSNPKQEWIKSPDEKNTYVNRFYFKINEKSSKMPIIKVTLYKNSKIIESRKLGALDIPFSQIAKGDKNFSQVIASELNLVASKTKQYTNKEVLTVIDINAKDSNLEDFSIKGIEEQGITTIEDKYPNQRIIYYLIIPIHKKSVLFTYYNTSTNKLERVSIPIILSEELVSTQTDLNPNDSNFEFYKKIAVGILAVILLVLFFWKRKKIYLFFALFFIVIFIISIIPNKTVRLKSNSVIYILPTKNSTIFKKVANEIVVEDMKRKNGFVKIMFGTKGQNYIGWVKEEDVSKN